MTTAASRNKVFVGNLAFATKEAQLADEFEEKCGKVVCANIITRGPRSLGYGFVEFETEEAAVNAVKIMDKATLDGRQINVELAKPREEGAATTSGEDRRPRTRGPRRYGGRPRAGPRATGDVRGRGARRGPASAPAGGATGYVPRAPAPRSVHRRRRRGPAGVATGATGAAGAPAGGSRRRAPRPRQERPKEPSTTTLFVANIPFAMDDEGLAKVFKDYPVKSAHVVTKPNGRSKGFGFVEFESTDAQKAALTLDKTVAGDRELSVKIALTPIVTPTEGEASGEASADKPAEPVAPTVEATTA